MVNLIRLPPWRRTSPRHRARGSTMLWRGTVRNVESLAASGPSEDSCLDRASTVLIGADNVAVFRRMDPRHQQA